MILSRCGWLGCDLVLCMVFSEACDEAVSGEGYHRGHLIALLNKGNEALLRRERNECYEVSNSSIMLP